MVMCILLEGGQLKAFFSPSAAIMIFGGTLGATLVSFPLQRVLQLPKIIARCFVNDPHKGHELVALFVTLAERARREGLLSLEEEAGKIGDSYLKKGILLVVDGTDPEMVRSILEAEIASIGERHEAGFGMLEAMGGYSPTMGIIGTVLGLVNVLGNLKDPEHLGEAIAVAFIATLYGVAFANLVWLPLGAKLKAKSKEEVFLRELMMEGILSVQAGDNPRVVREKLESFLPPADRGEKNVAEEKKEHAGVESREFAARPSASGN